MIDMVIVVFVCCFIQAIVWGGLAVEDARRYPLQRKMTYSKRNPEGSARLAAGART